MVTAEQLRAAFPQQPFERFGEACTHPKERRFLNGWREVCGACGQMREFGAESGDLRSQASGLDSSGSSQETR